MDVSPFIYDEPQHQIFQNNVALLMEIANMKLEITEQEKPLIVTAIDQSIASAKRQQTSGKSPAIKEVYQQHEAILQALKARVLAAK